MLALHVYIHVMVQDTLCKYPGVLQSTGFVCILNHAKIVSGSLVVKNVDMRTRGSTYT